MMNPQIAPPPAALFMASPLMIADEPLFKMAALIETVAVLRVEKIAVGRIASPNGDPAILVSI